MSDRIALVCDLFQNVVDKAYQLLLENNYEPDKYDQYMDYP